MKLWKRLLRNDMSFNLWSNSSSCFISFQHRINMIIYIKCDITELLSKYVVIIPYANLCFKLLYVCFPTNIYIAQIYRRKTRIDWDLLLYLIRPKLSSLRWFKIKCLFLKLTELYFWNSNSDNSNHNMVSPNYNMVTTHMFIWAK